MTDEIFKLRDRQPEAEAIVVSVYGGVPHTAATTGIVLQRYFALYGAKDECWRYATDEERAAYEAEAARIEAKYGRSANR